MTNKKQEKQVLIRQPALPLFSVLCLNEWTKIVTISDLPIEKNYFKWAKIQPLFCYWRGYGQYYQVTLTPL